MTADAGSDHAGSAPTVVAFGALLTLVVLAAWAAVALQPARASTSGCRGAGVAVIGDSIFDQARAEITAALAPRQVDIEAVAGRTFAEQLPAARQAAARRPAQVVINLGSNDVLLGAPYDVTVAALHDMVAAFPTSTCLHLVTVNETFFGLFPDGAILRQRSERLNAEIRRVAAERSAGVIDWADIVHRSIAADPAAMLTTDTVHPDDTGRRVLVEELRRTIERAESRAGPSGG
jgi:lysophospholipase L1-like esterase